MIDRSLNYGRNHVEKFLKLAGQYKSVLDVGAGMGHDLMIAKKISITASLFAIECFSEYELELVKNGMSVYSLNIEYDQLPFSDNSIDVIILNQVLEHTKEVFWIFHEISRVLVVGGKIILGVPNLASLHNRILLFFGKQPSPIKTSSAHVRGFTKGDIINFLDSCFPHGYGLRSFGGSNFYPFPPLLSKPLAKIFPTMAWGIFFMFEKQRQYKKEFLEYPVTNKLETNFYLGAS